jgi:hypothetical protein
MSREVRSGRALEYGKHLLIGGGLLVVLLWRAGTSLVLGVEEFSSSMPMVQRAFSLSAEEKIEERLEHWGGIYGWEGGELVELHRILSDASEAPDTTVMTFARKGDGRRGGMLPIAMLLFPTPFFEYREVPARALDDPEMVNENCWVVDFEVVDPRFLEKWFDRVDHGRAGKAGATCTVWRGKRRER